MRYGVDYDITVELAYPLDGGTPVSHANWQDHVLKLFGAEFPVRAMRDGPNLKITKRVKSLHSWDLANAVNTVILATQQAADGHMSIHITEVKEVTHGHETSQGETEER